MPRSPAVRHPVQWRGVERARPSAAAGAAQPVDHVNQAGSAVSDCGPIGCLQPITAVQSRLSCDKPPPSDSRLWFTAPGLAQLGGATRRTRTRADGTGWYSSAELHGGQLPTWGRRDRLAQLGGTRGQTGQTGTARRDTGQTGQAGTARWDTGQTGQAGTVRRDMGQTGQAGTARWDTGQTGQTGTARRRATGLHGTDRGTARRDTVADVARLAAAAQDTVGPVQVRLVTARSECH